GVDRFDRACNALESTTVMDPQSNTSPHSQGGADSVYSPWPLRAVRVGLAAIAGVAGKEKARMTIFRLYLLIDKQDNRWPMDRKKNSNAQALGRLGGKARAKNLSRAELSEIASKGGKARAQKLSPVQRREIALKAVAQRETKRKGR